MPKVKGEEPSASEREGANSIERGLQTHHREARQQRDQRVDSEARDVRRGALRAFGSEPIVAQVVTP